MPGPIYRAHLTLSVPGSGRGDYHTVDIPSIAEAQRGFWVNTYYMFTKHSDSRFWIPPSAIHFVEKINVL